MLAVIVFTDGRDDLLRQTLHSYRERVHHSGPVLQVMHDDTGNPEHVRSLRIRYPEWEVLPTASANAVRRGFGGAIAHAWDYLAAWNATTTGDQVTHVFHLEDDFLFEHDVDLDALAAVLADRPHLAQIALRRQPWNAAEREAGGVVEMHPDEYAEHHDAAGHRWLEHRLFFTTNPSLYRADLIERGWPSGALSEGEFTHRLLTDPALRFAYWGARDSGEWVTHIGAERVGTGY